MRPYVFDLEKQEHWKNCAESIYGGPIDKQLSTYNYFIKFVIEHGTYPSNKHTFTKYLSTKQANRKEYLSSHCLDKFASLWAMCFKIMSNAWSKIYSADCKRI
uniref:Uncharacterized protein n=1 Tax=Ditylenchus dipsaci TaxID=166011 RepID=A0A915EKR5_9BILA